MKCEICGGETKGEPRFDMHSPEPSSEFRGNETVRFVMCKACYDARNATQRTMMWSILLLVAGLLVVALLVWISG